jgi:hypothetical protein
MHEYDLGVHSWSKMQAKGKRPAEKGLLQGEHLFTAEGRAARIWMTAKVVRRGGFCGSNSKDEEIALLLCCRHYTCGNFGGAKWPHTVQPRFRTYWQALSCFVRS